MRSVTRKCTRIMASIAIAALVLLSGITFSDVSDADTSQGVSDIAVKVYDNSSAYADLVYMNAELPNSLNASEWVKDTDNLWYNINSLSPNYGKVLTNGMVTDITSTEIRSNILARYPVLDADFVILQITYKLNYTCSVTVSVDKDDVNKYSNMADVLSTVSHYKMDGMQRAVVLTVKNDPSANINVDSVRGEYKASLSYNGILAGSVSCDYLSSKLSAGGTLLDYAGNPISGASVSFGTLGSVYSDSSGNFSMYVDYGSIPVIQSIDLTGYTFSGLPMSYGTVTTDVSHDFTAAEKTLNVTINDGSGRAVSGVQARGYWYHDDGSGMVVETTGLTTVGLTDSNGKLRIAVDETKRAAMETIGAKLYVTGIDGTNYTFESDIMPGPGSHNPLPDPLTEAGNVYANVTTLADVSIATIEKSISVTVRGALDGSMGGGSPLPNAIVSAAWYYQTYDGAEYTISLYNDIQPGTFIDLVEGYIRINNTYSDSSGNVLVVYRDPSWTHSAGETAHLYVRVSGADPTSATDEYNFTTATIADGDKSIEELTADTAGSKASEMSAIPLTVTLRSNEVAYTVTGTVTGTLPATFDAFRITPSQKADTVTVEGTGIFTFPVMSGTSNTIELEAVEGYVFSNPSQTLPTTYADQNFASTCAYDTGNVDKSATVQIADYTVTGASIGTKVSATYQVAGTQVKNDVIADSDTIHICIYGRTGNVVDDIMITGTSDFYVGPITGTTAPGYDVAPRKVVMYVNSVANEPKSDNVVPGTEVQVYCGGSLYKVVTSDAAGITTSSLPEMGALTFRVGEYTATAALMASGPYTGYIAVNLAGITDPPTPADVTLTIRYIASASMQNTETPSNIDVMNSPVTAGYAVGSSQTFKAPELTGFEFAGWFLNGQLVSNARDLTQCTITITADMEGSELVASYAAEDPPQPVPDYGPIIAAGVLSVTLSLIALLYVILQRRY